MEIEATITVYEVDGTDTRDRKLKIKSHWNRKNLVVIEIGKTSYTVAATDLDKAVSRCSHY